MVNEQAGDMVAAVGVAALRAAEAADGVPLIFRQLVEVGRELGVTGIAKDRKNEQQNFNFRGIDDIMNVAGRVLFKHGVLPVPTYSDRTEVAKVTAKGTAMYQVVLKGIYTFVSMLDGSTVTVVTYGEAMDTADKATNKAESAALKYAILQLFLVPTEATDDADATTPEPTMPPPPPGYLEWWTKLIAASDRGFDPLRRYWNKSSDEFRTYTMDYRKDAWVTAKAHATSKSSPTAPAPEDSKEP